MDEDKGGIGVSTAWPHNEAFLSWESSARPRHAGQGILADLSAAQGVYLFFLPPPPSLRRYCRRRCPGAGDAPSAEAPKGAWARLPEPQADCPRDPPCLGSRYGGNVSLAEGDGYAPSHAKAFPTPTTNPAEDGGDAGTGQHRLSVSESSAPKGFSSLSKHRHRRCSGAGGGAPCRGEEAEPASEGRGSGGASSAPSVATLRRVQGGPFRASGGLASGYGGFGLEIRSLSGTIRLRAVLGGREVIGFPLRWSPLQCIYFGAEKGGRAWSRTL